MRFLRSLATGLVALASVANPTVTVAQDLPTYANFVVAGASGMSAWVFIHPADLIKTRMQLLGDSKKGATAVSVGKDLVKNEGVTALYAGLSAALARQASYTTLRLGLYDLLRKLVLDSRTTDMNGVQLLLLRILIGAVSGGMASFCSCPIEVCLVRMQADGKLPKDQQRGYRGVFHALYRIASDEGALAYWRGGGTTVLRAMVVSVSQIATYDQAKASLAPYVQGFRQHLVAGVISALTFTTISMPFDTVKTRVQQEKAGKKPRYTGTFNALATIARTESLGSLWTGFPPYLLAKGTLTVILFLIKEQYTELAKWLCSGGLKTMFAAK
ncbi:unnamed protein product [Ectocarpus sp. 4 AP-2014]